MSNRLNNKIKKIATKGAILLGTSIVLASSNGCTTYKELAAEEQYDIVDSNSIDNDGNELLSNGLQKIIDVPGENWKLVTEFKCDSSTKREWRITSDKFLYLTINTDGLPADYQVFIDNVHIDCSIKSKYASMDGINQDSMDDRIHNSQMIGFPISDTTLYYGVDAIEGCNESFISGSVHGFNGYVNGTVTEKRFSEADYIDAKVYGNKIQVVVDLLVKGPNDKDFRNISVNTDFIVSVSSKDSSYVKVNVFTGEEVD